MSPVYPELVGASRGLPLEGGWRVEEGSARRGDAYCDFPRRSLRVPVGPGERERLVRAHELMHLRISPDATVPEELLTSTTARARDCAEEYRVNRALGLLGLETEYLSDGSEREGGRLLAEQGDWAEAVCFYLAVRGTGGESGYLKGIARVRSPWAKSLREMGRRLDELDAEVDLSGMCDVTLDDDGCPRGYRLFTLRVAELATRTLQAASPEDLEDVKRLRRSFAPGARRAPSGVFAPLVWCDVEGDGVDISRGRRRGRASCSGSSLRYPVRLLTDPYARAFSSGFRRGGGVVILDQSGSMDLTREDVEGVARRAPGAWVIGYSHRPGDSGVTPNAWILAGPRGVARDIPSGNVGNGVDGPVLEYAVRLNRGGGRIYWVSDGQVTDSHDHPSGDLSRECALVLLRHRITPVRSVAEIGRTGTPRWERFGRVGAAVLALGRHDVTKGL